MSLPTLLSLVGMLFFGGAAVVFSIRIDRLKKELKEKEDLSKRRVYELAVLRSIQDRIGYSLDIERIIDTLTGSLKNLFPYSTVSSVVLHADEAVFKITLEERVGSTFITQVKKSMLASLGSLLSKPLPEHVEEFRSGVIVDETNGDPLSSFFHIPLIVNGNVVGLISISSVKPGLYKEADMTILYQMTETASNALSRLQDLINTEQEKLLGMITSLADGIVMIDNNYKLTLINKAAKDLLGIPHLENPTIFEVVNMLSKTTDFGAKIKESISQNKVIQEHELHLSEKIVQILVTPVLGPVEDFSDPTKRPVRGVTVLIHDITLEKSLQNLKEDFTNAVVHELRSPLTAIKAASEMMIESDSMPEGFVKLAHIIEEQSKRLLNEINSLLDAAKLEAGHFTIWQSQVDVRTVARESLDLFQAEAARKDIHLQLLVDDKLPMAFIDSARIDQVLSNLISNSLKFTEQGGTITLKVIGQFNPQLPKTATNPGILVSVTDTGIGISEEKQKTLFQKFAQGRPTDAGIKLQQGTGLGLYIVKGIVESHGGNVYVNSNPGQGTTIFFTLPVAKEESKPAFKPEIQEVIDRYTPKMLN